MTARFREGGIRIPAQHYGINPELVMLLTRRALEPVPDRLTPSMLPSRFAQEAFRKRDLFERYYPENRILLTCLNCGRKGKYDVGALVVDLTDPDPIRGMQCTCYFRCKHCNAAGAWEFPPSARFMITAAAIRLSSGIQSRDDRVLIGRISLHDGYEGGLATDREEHLLRALRRTPGDAWLWGRLGNLYHRAGRPDLAVAVFEESVRLDSRQFESHFSLGMSLSTLDHPHEAGYHLRQSLVTARDYDRLEPLPLREFSAVALRELFALHHRTEGKVPAIPTRADWGEERFASLTGNGNSMKYETYNFDMDDVTTFYAVAEGFVGRDRIPPDQRSVGSRAETAPTTGTLTRLGRKVGRNEPCSCGSGLKYKRCCGRWG